MQSLPTQPQNTPLPNRRQYQYNFTSEDMRHYFYQPSPVYIWLLVIGVLIMLIGILMASTNTVGVLLIVLGLICALFGGASLFGL